MIPPNIPPITEAVSVSPSPLLLPVKKHSYTYTREDKIGSLTNP